MKELLTTPDDAGFPLDLHHSMCFDSRRVELFDEALRAVVRPGDTVIDVGSGTGILSFLAWRAGAGRVIGIEKSELVETAREACAKHYPDAPVEFLRLDVLREALPDVKADVLVCELIGNLGLEEDIVPVLARLRSRLLREGGALIPSRMQLVGCPAAVPELYADLDRWTAPVRGVHLSPFRELAFHRVYHLTHEELTLLAEPRSLLEVDLWSAERTPTRLGAEFVAQRDGALHGVATWTRSQLAPGVVLDTGPEEQRTCWGHVFFPGGVERRVRRGERIGFELELDDDEFELEWRWKIAVGDEEPVSYSVRGQA